MTCFSSFHQLHFGSDNGRPDETPSIHRERCLAYESRPLRSPPLGRIPLPYLQRAVLEWFGKLWTHEGQPCLPADALEKCFEDAAKTRNFGATLAGAVLVDAPALLEFDGPKDVRKLAKNPDFRAPRKIAAFLNLCESNCRNRIRGCGYDGSIRFF